MCCGTAQNSYHTLAGMRVVLADGSVLDTARRRQPRGLRRSARPSLLDGLAELGARDPRARRRWPRRIRHKYRIKNTTGYSLNALVDFSDPVDILAHLMIGSEGTLGFISEITYHTVAEHAHKASALMLFTGIGDACAAVTQLKQHAGRRGRADGSRLAALGGGQAGHAGRRCARCREDGAALLVETRAADRGRAGGARSTRSRAARIARLWRHRCASPTTRRNTAALWNVRKGMFPAVGAMRATGTTVIIEDVAFPVERLADATLDLQRLLQQHGYTEAIIFGHALEGNLHFVFTQDFGNAAEVERYSRFMDAVCAMVVRQVRRLAEGRARHRPQHGAVRRAGMGRAGLAADAPHQGDVRSRRACSTPA